MNILLWWYSGLKSGRRGTDSVQSISGASTGVSVGSNTAPTCVTFQSLSLSLSHTHADTRTARIDKEKTECCCSDVYLSSSYKRFWVVRCYMMRSLCMPSTSGRRPRKSTFRFAVFLLFAVSMLILLVPWCRSSHIHCSVPTSGREELYFHDVPLTRGSFNHVLDIV